MKLRTTIFIALFSLSLTASNSYAGLSLMCSMFPVYDFTRQVARELADVKLLMRPGTEPHDYEPSTGDIMTLNNSDIFIFTGTNMETWAADISRSLSNTIIVDASEGITLTGNDPHIWLDLSLAQKMVMNISSALAKADPNNAQSFTKNAEEYCTHLQELDEAFTAMKKDKALVFAGEFSAGYFMRRYGFDYVSAYDGENEPSVRRMAIVIKHIRENGTRYIFADYGGITQVTRSISSETGVEVLTFGTGHNVPDTSTTFLQIMLENFNNIKEAMNDGN